MNFRLPLNVKYLECQSFTTNLNQLENLMMLNCMDIVSDFSLNNFRSLKRLEIWSLEHHLPLRSKKI